MRPRCTLFSLKYQKEAQWSRYASGMSVGIAKMRRGKNANYNRTPGKLARAMDPRRRL